MVRIAHGIDVVLILLLFLGKLSHRINLLIINLVILLVLLASGALAV